MEQIDWQPIEQDAGLPLVETIVDAEAVDRERQATYESYEKYLRTRLTRLDADRALHWPRDYSSVEAYSHSVEPLRARLKEMLGFWVEPADRQPVIRFNEETLFEAPEFIARRFRFEILPGLHSYAVELAPRSAMLHGGVLIQHGYAGTPELACGLTSTSNADDYSYRSMGIRAVHRGFHVIAVHHPSGYGTCDDTAGSLPAFPHFGGQYGKNRLHRLAVMAGGTLFGLDMMASSRGVDLLLAAPGADLQRVGMYGLSQGGQSTVYLPALDQRICASVASAWFSARMRKLIGPARATTYLDSPEEDKFFTDIIRLFSDSDVVSLICPRAFAVEAGLHDTSVDFELAQQDFFDARHHYERLGITDRIEFIPHQQGHVSATARAMAFLLEKLQ